MIQKTSDKIILTPFRQQFFKDIKVAFLVAIVGGVAGFFLDRNYYKGIAWGFAIMAVVVMVWQYIAGFHTQIIFDLKKQKIYSKNWWGNREILPFSETELLRESNNHGSLSYHLARKSDRYKSVQRISGYLSEKELLDFENKVISVISPLISPKDEKSTHSVNDANFTFK